MQDFEFLQTPLWAGGGQVTMLGRTHQRIMTGRRIRAGLEAGAIMKSCDVPRKLHRRVQARVGLLHLIRADTVSAYQRIRLFVWANSVKSPILIRTRKFLIQVTFQYVSSRFSTLQRRDAAPERREKGTKKRDERRARERGGATGV